MSEWISVEDRLPYIWIAVLVAVCPPHQMDGTHMAYINKEGKFEVLDEKGNHADFITHWMPLPSPPHI